MYYILLQSVDLQYCEIIIIVIYYIDGNQRGVFWLFKKMYTYFISRWQYNVLERFMNRTLYHIFGILLQSQYSFFYLFPTI